MVQFKMKQEKKERSMDNRVEEKEEQEERAEGLLQGQELLQATRIRQNRE